MYVLFNILQILNWAHSISVTIVFIKMLESLTWEFITFITILYLPILEELAGFFQKSTVFLSGSATDTIRSSKSFIFCIVVIGKVSAT